MKTPPTYCTLVVAIIMLGLSSLVFVINSRYFHYTGNSFFPPNIVLMVAVILVFNLGLRISFQPNSYPRLVGMELWYFLLVMSVIAYAANAVQLTPFPTIDQAIIDIDTAVGVNLPSLLSWLHRHPNFGNILIYTYSSLPHQMSYLPLLLIVLGRFQTLRDYYFLLLFTALIGFSVYYFLPTLAPASSMASPYFSPEQYATGLKFKQIHNHIPITTDEGGLIAFPSFHVVWALLCTYLLKEWKIVFFIAALFNSLLIVSCVLLGWHYITDVIGGIILTLIAGICLHYCQAKRRTSSEGWVNS